MARKLAKSNAKKEWPAVIYLGTFGFGGLSYVVARIVLDGFPHPYHWASGLAGMVLGGFGGWIWYRWRGDII